MRLGVVILVFIHFLIPKLTVVHGGVYLPHIFGDDMVMQVRRILSIQRILLQITVTFGIAPYIQKVT